MKRTFIILSIILISAAAASAQTRTPGSQVKAVRFFPNPAISYINFEFETPSALSNYSLKVYNFIGKKMVEVNSLTPRTVINLNDFFRGVYIFQLTDRNGQIIESGKFQVVK